MHKNGLEVSDDYILTERSSEDGLRQELFRGYTELLKGEKMYKRPQSTDAQSHSHNNKEQ